MIRLFTELQDNKHDVQNKELKLAIAQQGIVSLIERCQQEENDHFVNYS